LVASVAAGPYEDADAAERRDDHATAISIYRSLAATGNVAAMKRLGYFYEIGRSPLWFYEN
jgi:TPR repeat protein